MEQKESGDIKNSTVLMAQKLEEQLEKRLENVKQTVHKHLPQYEVEKMKVIALSGLTNQTYKVSHEGLESLVFRRFSDIYDRDLENQVYLALEKSLIAPKCFYVSKQIRIQKFVENAVHPSIEELRTKATKQRVLKLMHKYHDNTIQILHTQPLFLEYILSSEFLGKVKAHKDDKPGDEKFGRLFQETVNAFETLDRDLLLTESKRPFTCDKRVKFCHNDLNNLNIFFEPEVMFIDYEYSSYNFSAFDIANFLNESTIGYDVKQFPGFRQTEKISFDEILETVEMYPGSYQGMETDILKCLSLCNLYWAGWCVTTGINNPSNELFGTEQHGFMRLELHEFYRGMLKQHLKPK